MAWEWHAPDGVYKDHALSSKIRMKAVADSLFMRFVQTEGGFGKNKGRSVTITRLRDLPLASKVSETERLPTGRPAIDTKQVTADEWGFKLELTEFEENLTHFNLRNPFQRALRDQMRLTMDSMVATAMKATPYKYIPQAAGGAFDTDGTPTATADANFTVDDVRNIVDELSGTLKAPPFRNGKYVFILSTKAARGLMNDDEYRNWLSPTTSDPFTMGRIKDFERASFFVTNHFDALDNDVGSGGILGEAIAFGMDPAFLAVVDQPELRTGIPQDLGRFREVGWVGTLEAGLTWDAAAEQRVIHVTSA